MRLYFFHELPYPHVPDNAIADAICARIVVPNSHCDPKLVADLYDQYFEEFELADRLGLDIGFSEHHQSLTAVGVSSSIVAAALATRTKRAKIALLGIPLPIRYNPLQVAEDVAVLDCLSRGRIILCMLRGVPTEVHPSNINAASMNARMYEAHDLIVKAWTTPEPFSWEGQHFNFRYVNVWPRPYQQPHTPVWWPVSSVETAKWAADRRYAIAVHYLAFAQAEPLIEAYRKRYRENGFGEAPSDKIVYMARGYVADTDAQAVDESRGFLWYDNQKRYAHFSVIPGYLPPAALAKGIAKSSEREAAMPKNIDDEKRQVARAMAGSTLLAGSPQTMIKHLTDLHERLGIGHFVFIGRAGGMSTEKVRHSIELFAKEVYPAIRHLGETHRPEMASEKQTLSA